MTYKCRTITVRITEEDYVWLHKKAKEKDREQFPFFSHHHYTVSDLVRDLIRVQRNDGKM